MDDKDWQGRHMWNLQSNKNREAAFYGTLKIPFLFPKNDWQQLARNLCHNSTDCMSLNDAGNGRLKFLINT